MNALELKIHRANTLAFIAARPSEIALVPVKTRERVKGGGWEETPDTPRDAQTFRIIELGMYSTPPIIRTQDGKERKAEFWLLGAHDAAVAIHDTWTADDGRTWQVGDIIRPNEYETRALVAERGR